MTTDTIIGIFLGAAVGAVIYLWQRFIGKSDKNSENLLTIQLKGLTDKIDLCLAELKLKVDKEDCEGVHERCENALDRGFATLDLKRNITDCVQKELQRDANLENRRRAINGHTHDATGRAIFGGME
jgi:hypothetical protein